MKRKVWLRRAGALVLAVITLWTVSRTVGSATLSEAARALEGSSPAQTLLRWALGDVVSEPAVSFATALALYQAPALRYTPAADDEPLPADVPPDEPEDAYPPTEQPPQIEPDTAQSAEPLSPEDAAQGLRFPDNGVRAETVAPSADGYTVANGVLIRNRSDKTLDVADLSSGDFAARYGDGAPLVLIYHTHGSEAYTLPPGESYHSTGNYRSDEADVSVVGVGDEIADVLSSYGISVLHDRTRYDDPSYNAAYMRSGDALEQYLEKYPSLVYLLDIHRDAVQDGDGNQFKLVAKEDPRAAQLSLVMGVNHNGWEENLKLAAAVQRTIQASYPTLMRPISLLNANYNQNFSRGAMLLEVGAAGNSPDEAKYAARLFAHGFAKTILPTKES